VLLSLRSLPAALPEPGPGFPRFLSMRSRHGIPFQRRHSQRGRAEPQPPGMAAGAQPGFWDGRSRHKERHRHGASRELQMLQERHSQSGARAGEPGLGHLCGCHGNCGAAVSGSDLLSHGSVRGSHGLGSDGREFLSFQPGSGPFVVAAGAAQVTKRRWEQGEIQAEEFTNPLGHPCLECLRKCVRYGRE
ncbi:HA1F protein, partial [Smithornis capensis]|nr:HA1F protein [Smithornis capensis]